MCINLFAFVPSSVQKIAPASFARSSTSVYPSTLQLNQSVYTERREQSSCHAARLLLLGNWLCSAFVPRRDKNPCLEADGGGPTGRKWSDLIEAAAVVVVVKSYSFCLFVWLVLPPLDSGVVFVHVSTCRGKGKIKRLQMPKRHRTAVGKCPKLYKHVFMYAHSLSHLRTHVCRCVHGRTHAGRHKQGHLHTNIGAHTHTHTPSVLSPWCVLFMCFYVFPLVITWAFCSTGAPGDGKRRQTQFDVVEFSAIGE